MDRTKLLTCKESQVAGNSKRSVHPCRCGGERRVPIPSRDAPLTPEKRSVHP
jgi:hypothetical protein